MKKLEEAATSVLPIAAIVLLLHFTLAPLPGGNIWLFLWGLVLLILGMGLFTLGADVAMMPMGEHIGSQLTRSRSLKLLVCVGLAIGVMITVAEPDLQVLATQVPAVPNMVLILTVAVGVGIFLMAALLRIVFAVKLNYLLIGLYLVVFVLAAFTSPDYVAVAFDSGGVTTGPITVPFIMALGVGVAAVRSGREAQDDSFGLVALASIGPVMAVLLLGMFYQAPPGMHSSIPEAFDGGAAAIFARFLNGFAVYAREIAVALLPIVAFFLLFQIWKLKLPIRSVWKILMGVLYTYVGLVLFLTGVNVGFLPAGYLLGESIASLSYSWILIPLGMLMGFFVVSAEPAVHVLKKQVEEISGGAISGRAMMLGLSLGVAAAIGLAMVRVLTGLSIWALIIPGYAVALVLPFFVPPIFTAIAFDSGGVASGPMTATFLLPFAMGACTALGGNLLTDAFGIVAMVAMTPLIAIQILGVIYRIKLERIQRREEVSGENVLVEFGEEETDDGT